MTSSDRAAAAAAPIGPPRPPPAVLRMWGRVPHMTSSDRAAAAAAPIVPDVLPPALSSMWRLCKLGYRHEPRLMLVAFALSLLSALPDALLGRCFKLLGEGVLDHAVRVVRIAAIGLGVSATATWFLRTVSTRV